MNPSKSLPDTSSVSYINANRKNAVPKLGSQLQLLLEAYAPDTYPVILCIGTDRVTGDSLGPLTGSFLTAYGGTSYLPVYGTLELPVHALNLQNAYSQIKKRHPRRPVLAVDASLGTENHLGYITLGQGCLKPGAGVRKNLPSIGDFFITGIISPDHPKAQLSLQNARLSLVVRMACCIAQGILSACAPAALTAASASHFLRPGEPEAFAARESRFAGRP